MKPILILTLLSLASAASAGTDRLFAAVVAVESNGRADAVGDHGLARGLIQAHRAAWREGCEALGVRWSYTTGVKDAAKCRAVFYAYTGRYGARTAEQRARTWNGGPAGARSAATLGYWRRVKARL